MLLIFMTKTYCSPDCEKVGDYEEDVDCDRKDQQRLWFLAKLVIIVFSLAVLMPWTGNIRKLLEPV